MNRMRRLPLPRSIRPAAVAAASLVLLVACGREQDASDRRPIGQARGPTAQQQLPEGHPPIGRPSEGTRAGTLPSTSGAAGPRRDLPPAVTVHLDSGNVAYRAGDYEEARRHYRAAVREDSTASAAWFGVYMAERALGDRAAADSALRRAGGLGEASGVHAAPADTAAGHAGGPESSGASGGR